MPESTWDCNLSCFNLPVAPFVIIEKCQTWNEVDKISRYIEDYPFVKTCEFSPKDWKDPPVFSDASSAVEALKNSNRCHLNRHIVMKKERQYSEQSRVYWCEDKPRLVCGNMEHCRVTDFLDRYHYDIPFHYCCIELGCGDNQVEVIEINTFSTRCDPSPLDWKQDWEKILFSPKIIWCDILKKFNYKG